MRCGIAPLSLVVLPLALACGRHAGGSIQGIGTLELVEVDVGPTTPARVVRVLVEEGDRVRVGDTILTLSQPTSGSDIDQRRARVAAERATLRELVAGSRPREIERAAADLAAAEAEADRAARDYERSRPLGESGTISRQALDDAHAAAEATAADLVLTAPVDATVLSRNAEPGEMLTAGQSAVTLGQVRRPWTRVYLSSLVLPRVRVGQAAVATLDGLPGRRFPGKVVSISDRAEFTPRIALTETERADLLFGVKVAFEDTTGTLKPGLPATVEILPEGAPR
jgi:HlyD family secretion protein